MANIDRSQSLPGLRTDDPVYPAAVAAATGLDPLAQRAMDIMLQAVPIAHRHDPQLVAADLSGEIAYDNIRTALAHGRDLADDDLTSVEAAAAGAGAANDDLRQIAEDRAHLPKQMVDFDGTQATRTDVRADKAVLDQVAANRDIAGDREHLQQPDPAWRGWAAAVVIAVIEGFVTWRIFGVDLSHLTPAALTWVAVTAGSVFFFHWVTEWLGARLRDYRETRNDATALTSEAWNRLHPLQRD